MPAAIVGGAWGFGGSAGVPSLSLLVELRDKGGREATLSSALCLDSVSTLSEVASLPLSRPSLRMSGCPHVRREGRLLRQDSADRSRHADSSLQEETTLIGRA